MGKILSIGFQCRLSIVGGWLLPLFLLLAPVQIWAQNDSISLDEKDTLVQPDIEKDSISSKEKTKIFVVEGTVITNLEDNNTTEIVYIEEHENNSIAKAETKRISQKSKNLAQTQKATKKNKTSSPVNYKPYKSNPLNLNAGLTITAAIAGSGSSYNKRSLDDDFELSFRVEWIGFLPANRKIPSKNQKSEGFLHICSLSIRPPPTFS